MKIQFYLNEILTDVLLSKGNEGDSPHLIAKGLIEEILKGDRQSTPMPPDLGDRLSDFEDRLEQVENQFLSPEDLERLAGILLRDYFGEGWSLFGDRLSALEKKIAILPPDLDRRLKILDDLITQIANFDPAPKETAIMIQKQPLPTPPTPTEITLTHEEAAREFQRTARTVKGWANDPDKWPEGWIYDGDRQFWIKEV